MLLPKKKVGKKPPVNPLEPVRASWVKVKAKEFKKDRLLFNPYAFGQPTCLDDSRFYCKMHQQVFHQRVRMRKNAHVPTDYFNLDNVREHWPDVMALMDFHQISKIMTVSTPYSPDLLQQFYATVHFSTDPQRSLTWMSANVQCSATLAEFGALFGLSELQPAPCYVRLHLSKPIPAESGIRHCYPPGIGLRGKIPKTVYMYPYWKVVHGILRNCLACKFGEKGMVRDRMVNCLYHFVDPAKKNKQIDILDYLWQEMQQVVLRNQVPIYGPLLQTLFNNKLPASVVEQFKLHFPDLISIPPMPVDGPVWPPSHAAHEDEEEDVVPPKKQGGILDALKMMNCFAKAERKEAYQSYRRQKTIIKNQHALMDHAGIAHSACSSEVSENTFMARNKYTHWFGDDASSLYPFWQGDSGQSSSAPPPPTTDVSADDSDGSDDEEEEEETEDDE